MHLRATILDFVRRYVKRMTLVLAWPLLLTGPQLFAQQYVGRFEIYAGYMFLDSPKLNLFEPGYHIQAGMRYSRLISMGFDYSRGTGDTALTADLATDALQAKLK